MYVCYAIFSYNLSNILCVNDRCTDQAVRLYILMNVCLFDLELRHNLEKDAIDIAQPLTTSRSETMVATFGEYMSALCINTSYILM